MLKGRFLRASLRKWRKLTAESPASGHGHQCDVEEETIPKDVPKGHLVVYVGDELRRFVIHVSLLDHPLFRSLLDRAREVYGFSPGSKLCIPCDEAVFLAVLRCVGSQQERGVWLCF